MILRGISKNKFGIPLLLAFSFLLLLAACNQIGNSTQSDDTVSAGEETSESGSATIDSSPGEGEAVGSGAEGQRSDERPGDGSEEEVERSFAGSLPAPEFPAGLDWLNSDGPLSLADLRGKVVLLDFWTYGCINCMHIIPDLKKLEEKYADELVVIGVHSAKFENEGDTDNIRNVILRYELEHPVVNDNQFQVWSEYGARAWPTLVLIDPDGNVLGFHSGEGIYDLFDQVIAGMVAEFDDLGRIDRTPLDLKLEGESLVNSPLLFPGKVLADEENERLFIADSNHNRIVISDLEGNVLEVVGDGRQRLQDGDFESASFFRPQGLTLANDDTLYVADTENHAIRKVDLNSRQVETVAGTGQQVYIRVPSGPALSTPLNSPWDVLYHDGQVFVAMAGQHQIWVYSPDEETISRYAGSGREELLDGQLVQGGLNQPSGLATDGDMLYIADSEASAIRTADLDPDGQLETIVGTGLFDFGDVDGQGDEVRLQHPLGVVFLDNLLYVADTYNSKIKIIDPATRESTGFLGGDESGWRDGPDALFDEPGGLSLGEDKLYIADTNNHVIRVANLNTKEVETLVLIDNEGLLTRQPADAEYRGKVIALESQTISAGSGSVRLEVTIPEGYKVNEFAPFSMEWTGDNEGINFDAEEADRRIVEPEFPLSFPAEFSEGEAELTGDLVIYYCDDEAESLCFIEQVKVTAPFTVTGDGQETLVLSHDIPTPAEN